MSFFRLNVDDINENVNKFTGVSKKLIDNKDLVCESLIQIDFSWTDDPLTNIFISNVKNNDIKLDDYIQYLNKLYKEMSNFCTDITYVCNRFNYRNLRKINFNDNRKDECLRYLNQTIELLNINLQRLKSVKNDIDYLSVSSLNQKIEQINSIIKMINLLKEDISNFCDLVNDCLENSRSRKGHIERIDLNISLMNYESSLKDR